MGKIVTGQECGGIGQEIPKFLREQGVTKIPDIRQTTGCEAAVALIDKIFFERYAPTPDNSRVWHPGQKLDVVSLYDHYAGQSALADAVVYLWLQQAFKHALFVSGDIQTDMPPIGFFSLSRVLHALGIAFAENVTFAPFSVHTGTDATLSLEFGRKHITPDADGKLPLVIPCRNFHALRCETTTLQQAPEVRPVMYPCSYLGYGASNWTQSISLMAWLASEMDRVGADKADQFMAPVDGYTRADIKAAGATLKAFLTEQCRCDYTQIARGAPASDGTIQTERPDRRLCYPREAAGKYCPFAGLAADMMVKPAGISDAEFERIQDKIRAAGTERHPAATRTWHSTRRPVQRPFG